MACSVSSKQFILQCMYTSSPLESAGAGKQIHTVSLKAAQHLTLLLLLLLQVMLQLLGLESCCCCCDCDARRNRVLMVSAAAAAAVLQLYAPVEGAPSSSFHRCIYLFCCFSCGSNLRAVSVHLARDNEEYPYSALSTFFPTKKAFWGLWQQQQQQQQQQCMQEGKDREKKESSSSSSTDASPCASAAESPQQQQLLQQQVISEDTQIEVIKKLQRGEKIRQLCCCPMCGLAGGETVGDTELAAAAALLQQQLRREERRLQVLLQQQRQEIEAAAAEEETDTAALQDLDNTEFEYEDTETDQRGLLALDAMHIQGKLNPKP